MLADGDVSTYWQSPENQPAVNFSIDLRNQHEIAGITARFLGPPPKAMVLLRSQDGVAWQPYHYFAAQCAASTRTLNLLGEPLAAAPPGPSSFFPPFFGAAVSKLMPSFGTNIGQRAPL